MTLALLLLRLVVGLSFVAHGAQKLFGWFGGEGLRGTEREFEELGYRWPLTMAVMAGLGELTCGLLIALGLAIPFATLVLCTVMISAIAAVHWPHGFWNYKGGFELNLVYVSIALAVSLAGPGEIALDALLGWDRPTEPWVVVLLVACALTTGLGIHQLASDRSEEPRSAQARRS